MRLKECTAAMLPVLEAELQRQVRRTQGPATQAFYDMLTYHMGWTGPGAGSGATGKRIRPLLVLLVTGSCGGEWLRAISPAAAVELIHNFSLVHDDIEDNSATRRGRLTLWKMHGIPMATNAGDALFSIANRAMVDASTYYPAEAVLRAAATLHDTCLTLTLGQYLDMSYEKRSDLSVNDYWPMIEGKTAALISAAARIGAILGGASEQAIGHYADFGRNLGLAFQVQDDILGIWGDEKATGKSAASDLAEGKNSLPVLYGIGRDEAFARRWAQGRIKPEETQPVAQLLKDEGAYDYCMDEAKRLTTIALASLNAGQPKGETGEALSELANQLLDRRS